MKSFKKHAVLPRGHTAKPARLDVPLEAGVGAFELNPLFVPPLPEDFALRGLLWTNGYFPSDWYSNDNIDDDEKYFEVASMADERIERILWLGVYIAQHEKWLFYDEKSHQFSVPSRFEQKIDTSMNVGTDVANILNPSQAPALSSAGDDA
ncbi:uncharacterized protein PG998_014458 [Apiospora kogelbergensis]|uniref:uncharacterized protein n=1 Tax=Apiospora kogelbergensis TaxID=1337665 RepID=UPI003130F142